MPKDESKEWQDDMISIQESIPEVKVSLKKVDKPPLIPKASNDSMRMLPANSQNDSILRNDMNSRNG